MSNLVNVNNNHGIALSKHPTASEKQILDILFAGKAENDYRDYIKSIRERIILISRKSVQWLLWRPAQNRQITAAQWHFAPI